jgi:thymidine kinase
MDFDDNAFHLNQGWIAFVWGSMFSGKTEKTINLLRRADQYAKLQVQAFKWVKDDRYGTGFISTHDGITYPATEVGDVGDLTAKLNPQVQLIGITETQFYSEKIIDFCLEQRARGRKLIVEGLLTDFRREKFKFRQPSTKDMSDLLAHADYALLQKAFCYNCGQTAIYTMRLVPSPELVLIGGKDSYAAACARCHKIPQ